MKPLKDFNEFIEEGVVKKQKPDKSRATSLVKDSENSFFFLTQITKTIGIRDDNANYFIKNLYDVLMELIRARMLLEGLNSSGQGAHEAEVSYLRKLSLSEVDIDFANQLRYFRNGITYYGKKFDKEYAEKAFEFIKNIKPKLISNI